MGQVAFIGLGVMGAPMARHLTRQGHDVTVFNRTTSKADAWIDAHGGWSAESPAEAAAEADFVMLCVGNDDDVRDVVFGDQGALSSMTPGAVLIDHTTASADVAREVGAAASALGVGFIDAPVSGGQAGAETGSLTVMCGCDDLLVFQKARPVIMSYAKACEMLGGVGSGQLTKMVNQICIAGLVEALAEGVNFAKHAGLDVAQVVEVIGKGAAQSWQMDNRALTMAQGHYNFGFAVEWMRKDLAICLAEAARNGSSLPVTEIIDQRYAAVEGRGGKRWDTSSLMALLDD